MGTEIVCGLCKHIAYRDRDIDETTFKCDWCGATLKGNKWVKVCSECRMETDKLYDLFVPHHFLLIYLAGLLRFTNRKT